MINILFFAKFREQLGTGALEFPLEAAIQVKDLRLKLTEKGEDWRFLINKSALCAVNQEMVNNEAWIKSGDEVAFFPFVTGG